MEDENKRPLWFYIGVSLGIIAMISFLIPALFAIEEAREMMNRCVDMGYTSYHLTIYHDLYECYAYDLNNDTITVRHSNFYSKDNLWISHPLNNQNVYK